MFLFELLARLPPIAPKVRCYTSRYLPFGDDALLVALAASKARQ